MAWRCGSLPRAVMSSARSSVPRIRPSPLPPPLHSNRLHCRRPILSLPTRPIGALGCTQSLMPLHSTVAVTLLTSHISFQARARCELSQGT